MKRGPGARPARTTAASGGGFRPISPAALAAGLADLVLRRLDVPSSGGRVRLVVDGLDTSGAGTLADAVAGELAATGVAVVRLDTRWWWRAASLRLELGHQDVDMLLSGWVDGDALTREALGPLGPGGSGRHLTRLRDPDTDRSVREPYRQAPDRVVTVLSGPFLLLPPIGPDPEESRERGTSERGLRPLEPEESRERGTSERGLRPSDTARPSWELAVHLHCSPQAAARQLPDDRQWWVPAWRRYLQERPQDRADMVVAADHPASPAVRGLA
ncbi:nucleoside/nucleotide kinase family protein [Nakamurella leprariae]|uniref:Uridine kinase n=1 Tax=Nakamurella leprariae TaxID=2803911 RepID=A0A938Y5B7_9ACTN|nr:hypothetical protein [Nakamurella leprariae]MBM9466321.1 hypothetical protein [Nakamurella leprariae]